MELDCVLPLKALLKTSPESAVTLLSALSAHPPNNVRFPAQQDHNDGVGNFQSQLKIHLLENSFPLSSSL